jgi:putative SOS response-associated peptidase YedK
MCGRFSIAKEAEDIVARFEAGLANAFSKNYNAAPTQNLPVKTNSEPHVINFYRWGLVPFWAKDESIGSKLINARAETVSIKPSFKNSLKSRRCLVISDGFFEWKKMAGLKQPYRVTLKNEDLYAYAGLWDIWKDTQGNAVNSFTIITTDANELVSELHNRMPVILNREDEALWLDNHAETGDLLNLLKPFPSELMTKFPVSTLVNSPLNNSPDIIKRIKLT